MAHPLCKTPTLPTPRRKSCTQTALNYPISDTVSIDYSQKHGYPTPPAPSNQQKLQPNEGRASTRQKPTIAGENSPSASPRILPSMTTDASNHENSIASTILFGLLGVSLAYFGRRNKTILGTIGTTLGYSLITKAVSTTVIAALRATEG